MHYSSEPVLLEPSQLHDYQREAVRHQLAHPDSMLWLQPGLGKTAVTLTTIVDRMRAGIVTKTLVFGPLRVIQAVWAREARKWSHTRHLRFAVLHGTREQRTRLLFSDADIFLCNYEGMTWLAETLDHYYISQKKPLPFQMVVYDEVSKMKNSTARRMAGGIRVKRDARGDEHKIKVMGWRKMIPHFAFRTGLTGTPASNGYLDLHGQFLAVDGGKRLGEYVTHYKDSYFEPDYMGWKYSPTEQGKKWIETKIADITLKMDAKDYLDLPERKVVNMMVEMPESARRVYREVEAKMFAALDSGNEIELFSKNTFSNAALQLCNGSPYVNRELGVKSEMYDALHDAKLDALEEVIEEAQGSPVLCSYSFIPDAKRIMERFKKLKPVNMNDVKSSATEDVVNRWNQGRIKLLVGHPATMGHGIDGLQEAGSILVWYGLPWSLELYDQMCKRLDRQGQRRTVSIIRILCSDSLDLAVAESLERKIDDEEGLKRAVQLYRDGLLTNDLNLNFY